MEEDGETLGRLPGAWGSSQLGMLMPAGMPEPAKVRTSREVKSGVRNLSFSKAGGQGSSFSSCSALATSRSNLALMALFTMATKPAGESGLRVGRAWEGSSPSSTPLPAGLQQECTSAARKNPALATGESSDPACSLPGVAGIGEKHFAG